MSNATTKDVVKGFTVLEPRIPHLCDPTVGSERRRTARTNQSAISAKDYLPRPSCLGNRREEEVWETLSYAVLWLSGLWTIGLCCI